MSWQDKVAPATQRSYFLLYGLCLTHTHTFKTSKFSVKILRIKSRNESDDEEVECNVPDKLGERLTVLHDSNVWVHALYLSLDVGAHVLPHIRTSPSLLLSFYRLSPGPGPTVQAACCISSSSSSITELHSWLQIINTEQSGHFRAGSTRLRGEDPTQQRKDRHVSHNLGISTLLSLPLKNIVTKPFTWLIKINIPLIFV